jgi:hypothetical protein
MKKAKAALISAAFFVVINLKLSAIWLFAAAGLA